MPVSVFEENIAPTISCTCSSDNCVFAVPAIVTAPPLSVIVMFEPAVNANVSEAPNVLPPAVTVRKLFVVNVRLFCMCVTRVPTVVDALSDADASYTRNSSVEEREVIAVCPLITVSAKFSLLTASSASLAFVTASAPSSEVPIVPLAAAVIRP